LVQKKKLPGKTEEFQGVTNTKLIR
jgi:hypothetical protein